MTSGREGLDRAAWEERYLSGDTRWDRGEAAPPFREWLAAGAPLPIRARGRVAVLGCGRGHDAILFARAGFDVTGFDFAPSAVRTARALAGVSGPLLPGAARFEERDVLELPGEHARSFDAVVEHTCFCAIEPSRREDYVRAAAGLLVPGGRLLALFYPFGKTEAPGGGPPFLVSEPEIRALFGERFRFLRFETPAESFESRRGRERLALLEKVEAKSP